MTLHVCNCDTPAHILQKYSTITVRYDLHRKYTLSVFTSGFMGYVLPSGYLIVDLTEDDLLFLKLSGNHLLDITDHALSAELLTQLKNLSI